MNKDPVNDYVDARTAFVKIDEELDKLAGLFFDCHQNLHHSRRKFIFGNTKAGTPAGVALGENAKRINADAWKTPEEINEIIGEWHRARNTLKKLWEALPKEKQEGVNSPPKGVDSFYDY